MGIVLLVVIPAALVALTALLERSQRRRSSASFAGQASCACRPPQSSGCVHGWTALAGCSADGLELERRRHKALADAARAYLALPSDFRAESREEAAVFAMIAEAGKP